MISNLGRIVVGGTLVYSAVLHAAQPYLFAVSIEAYQLIPVRAVYAAASIVPYFQLTTGACLIFSLFRRESFLSAIALLGAFALMQATVLARGMSISCGCFGMKSQDVTFTTLALTLILFVLLLPSGLQYKDRIGVDRAAEN